MPCFELGVEFRVACDTVAWESGTELRRRSQVAGGVAVGFLVPALQPSTPGEWPFWKNPDLADVRREGAFLTLFGLDA